MTKICRQLTGVEDLYASEVALIDSEIVFIVRPRWRKQGFHVDPTRVRSPQDKALVERMVRHAREDCFAGERLHDLDEARRRGAHWCRHEYGMRQHSRTRRRPLELFEHDEQPRLAPPPSSPYDMPVWAEPKVARDQHVQLAKALYSLPREHQGRSLIARRIRARADRHTVRFYDHGEWIKTHARQPPGARATNANDCPADKVATAQRDLAFIQRQAHQHGPSIGAYARALLPRCRAAVDPRAPGLRPARSRPTLRRRPRRRRL